MNDRENKATSSFIVCHQSLCTRRLIPATPLNTGLFFNLHMLGGQD